MSDIVLRTATRTQVQLHSLVASLGQMMERLSDEERGQDVIEYVGVLAVVAVIIGIVVGVAGKLGNPIYQGVTKEISSIFNH